VHGVDDGPGRPDHEPARGGNHRSTGKDPGDSILSQLAGEFGMPHTRQWTRRRAGAKHLVQAFAGSREGNDAGGEVIMPNSPMRRANTPPIGGLKVTPAEWCCRATEGTETIYKMYADVSRDEAPT